MTAWPLWSPRARRRSRSLRPSPRPPRTCSRMAIPSNGAVVAQVQYPTTRSRQRARTRRRLSIISFRLPALVLFTGLVLLPIGLALYTSFFKWNGFGGLPTHFVGLDNFFRLLGDEVFIGDLERGLVLVLLSVLVQLPVALGLALLLNQKLR